MMQRDFLGLPVIQETDYAYAPAPVRTSQLQMEWPFSNKGSSSSSLLSFHVQGEQPKHGLDILARKNEAGVRYSTTNQLAKQLNAYPFHRSMVNQTSPTISPAMTSVVDLRKASKNSQLTIFYNGSVCVYENVTPDKAQAIMLLAGNGPPAPVPVTNSISVSPSGANLVKIVEPHNVVNSLGAAPLLPGAVPQLQRRSLARFMERRKERSIAANPYGTAAKLEVAAKARSSVDLAMVQAK